MKRLAIPLVLLAAIAVGCKPASLAGTYKGSQGSLVLAQDGTFTMTGNTGMAGANEMKGKWTEADKKVTIKPETIGGKTIAELIPQLEKMAKAFGAKPAQVAEIKQKMDHFDATVSEDRKTLTISGTGQPATFTKEG